MLLLIAAAASDAARTGLSQAGKTHKGEKNTKGSTKNKANSPPVTVAFDVTGTVAQDKLPGWGPGGRGGVKLQPPNCANDCRGFTQSLDVDKTNEVYILDQKGITFEPAGSPLTGSGAPTPFLQLQLRSRGLQMPQDVGAAVINVTAVFTPVNAGGGTEAPPSSDAFNVTFGVMWTMGGSSPPNTASLFSLVGPLPSKEFVAYGVTHRFTMTGIQPTELSAATGIEGKKLWWNKEADSKKGYGAIQMPTEYCKWYVELVGELTVL